MGIGKIPVFFSNSLATTTDIDIYAASCTWNSMAGRMVISLNAFRFIYSFPRKEICSHPFVALDEICKNVGKSLGSNKQKETSLVSVLEDGVKVSLDRDEVPNIVIAFSGVKWEVLQPRNVQSEKGVVDGAKKKVKVKIGLVYR
ncbi:hypothetical protein EJ08DRAFT_653910 [Tothia fuscella]|uniref:Uncharacterized protein n=1 Tax=Tothia fuscella TaxID=1048955 RepID=A0A9P4TTL2_9PEZI|nr:hypothetical protein EJ08DRAFT_653910 [Tothia fuscella]